MVPSISPLLLTTITLACGCFLPPTLAQGELAAFDTNPFSGTNISHRQNVCHRYELFAQGQLELRHALAGLELRPLIAKGIFFHYTEETGIDPVNPGILVDLLDALAERANFTWRQSFGVMNPGPMYNMSWTNMLVWGVDTYDISVNWWDHTVARMELGAAFMEPWFDGSLILIDQKDLLTMESADLDNWLSPFDAGVWAMVGFTILLSAVVYILIEYLSGERDERSLWQWFSDNLYLSSINFSQNFEYAPNSVAGRLFCVSMCMWALVMTATYTANLASLFVENNQKPPLVIDSIEQAVLLGVPICTFANTNSDAYIRTKYTKAIRVPKVNELETYRALRRGECGLLVAYKDNWLTFQQDQKYNPDCDLEWVGRTVKGIKSGLAVKADAGDKCSSLIRDVLNLHFVELISAGILDEIWKTHRDSRPDGNNCNSEDANTFVTSRDFSQGLRRRLWSTGSTPSLESPPGPASTAAAHAQRVLKAAGIAANTGGEGDGNFNPSSLSLDHMMGTFLFHWIAMASALFISAVVFYYEKWVNSRLEEKGGRLALLQRQEQSSRDLGIKATVPGMSSRQNTFVVRKYNKTSFMNLGNDSAGSSGGMSFQSFRSLPAKKEPSIRFNIPTSDREISIPPMSDNTCPTIMEDQSLREASEAFKEMKQKQESIDQKLGMVDDSMQTFEDTMSMFEHKMNSLLSLQETILQNQLRQKQELQGHDNLRQG